MKNKTVHKYKMDAYLILSIVTLISAIVLVAMKICFASKCEEISFCYGILRVNRNVSMEDREFHGSVRQEITQMQNVTSTV
jgi:translation elongation factor EF-1beta